MNRFLSIIFAGILAYPISSLAEGNHIEFSILDSSWDTGISNVSGATLDEDDTGFAIVWGGPFTDNIDLEIGYADFGEASLSGTNGNTFDYRGLNLEWSDHSKNSMNVKRKRLDYDKLYDFFLRRVDKLAITSSVQNEATDYIERIASQVVGGRALNDAQAEAVSTLIDKGIETPSIIVSNVASSEPVIIGAVDASIKSISQNKLLTFLTVLAIIEGEFNE